MFEDYHTEEQSSVVHFYGQKDSMQRIITKNVSCLSGLRNSLKGVQKSQMTTDQVTLLILRQKQLCSRQKS
jgi:hypothetical protein